MKINVLKSGGYSGGGLSIDGGQLTGPLMLYRNPELPLEAATKQYIDTAINSLDAGNFSTGTLPITRLPSLSGDVTNTAGDNNIVLSNTGIIAGEYSKVTVDSKGRVIGVGGLIEADLPNIDFGKITTGKPTTLSGYGITDAVSTSGGLMTGPLTLNANPINNQHLVTKQFVDSLVGSFSGANIGDIIRKPYSETPSGFLKCNGAEVDKTTYANLYAVIGDQYNNNSIPGSGQPWRQQYQINDQQSVDIGTWATGTSLPRNLGESQAIVTKNRVYLLGGYTTGVDSIVHTAPINADGTLGAWSTSTALPGILCASQAIVTKNRVYLLGGYTDISPVSTVYTAPINADGTLGNWITGTSLPGALGYSSSIITKNRVYLLGGYAGSFRNTVYTAPINSDGTLGTWTTGTSLPGTLGHSAPIITKNRVYLLGGKSGPDVSTVYTAAINSDGTLGTWTTSTSLPGPLGESQAIVTKNRVYLLGGHNGSYVSTVYTATINADGTLGTWSTGTSLPGILGWSQAISTKNRIYLLGGLNPGYNSTVYTATITGGLNDYSAYYTEDTNNYMMPGSGKPWQQQYQINITQSGDITGWTTGTSLPIALSESQVIVTKNRVYLLGGSDGSTPLSTVYTAPINTDGTLGTWTTGTSLPSLLNGHQSIITKNYVYILGGSNGTNYLSTVYMAPINADGTLGTWTIGTSLPGSLGLSQAITTKNRVYLLGGTTNGSSFVATVYTATINADGTLGTWTTGTSLPATLAYSQAIVTKNRVYLLGGYSSGWSSTVYTASINSDGTLGTWTTGTSLPGLIGRSGIYCTKNRVYLFGGDYNNQSTFTALVHTAPINADGTLGTWTTGTSLPAGNCFSQVIATKNRIYLLGGRTEGSPTTSIVYTASISDGLNDYSPYYDGTILPIEPINSSTVFRLPDYSNIDINGIYHYIKY